MQFFKDFKKHFMISSALYMLLGFVILIWPTTSLKVIWYAFGITTLIYGIVHLIGYITHDFGGGFLHLNLFTGIICFLLGIFLLSRPVTIFSILPFVLGIILILGSITKIQNAFELKHIGYSRWWSVLLLAVATILFGIILLIYPFAAVSTLVRFIGASFAFDGAVNLWSTFCISNKMKR